MSDQIRVQLSFGSLEGARSESGVLVFKNIPFASAKRWQAPGPVESFDCSARDPQSYGPAPIQPPPDPFWAKRSGEALTSRATTTSGVISLKTLSRPTRRSWLWPPTTAWVCWAA